jgi:hypothetical protein
VIHGEFEVFSVDCAASKSPWIKGQPGERQITLLSGVKCVDAAVTPGVTATLEVRNRR